MKVTLEFTQEELNILVNFLDDCVESYLDANDYEEDSTTEVVYKLLNQLS